MHDVRYNAVHDEIVVPVPYSESILTFRGGADGQEAPIRIIQGPETGEIGSRLDVDPIHDEIFTYTSDSIKVYPREANGDAAPIRIIEGPDTQLEAVYRDCRGSDQRYPGHRVKQRFRNLWGQYREISRPGERRNPDV